MPAKEKVAATLMSENKNYTYQSIANSIYEHGVDTLFGLMGDANLFVVDHFVRSCGSVFVPAVHEGSAVLMALAYSHVSGKIGVATVTHGPALTNCVTALTEGARGHIPMVLLTGETPIMNPHSLQNIDQRELIKVTGAGWVQLRSPQTAAYDVAHAFYRARVERRPIVLNMPADFMWQEVDHERIVFSVFDAPSFVPEGRNFDEALGMIASAKRPMILAGLGAVDARDALISLADRLEAPLATTLKAKDLFLGHPYNIGIFGTLSTPEAYSLIEKSDCIVSFGASLHHFTTDRGALINGKRVIQVNNSTTEIGCNARPDAALVADARLTAINFVYWLDEAEISPSGFTKEIEGPNIAIHPVHSVEKAKDGHINYTYALGVLEKELPTKRVLVTDGGRFMTEVWSRISAPDPKNFLLTANFGSIGLGLQEAIGAACAAPDRPIVLFTGDGGFMMGGINEFNTAVRLKHDLIVIVCNDSAYGAEHIQFLDRGMSPSLTLFDWPSFADVANSLGGQGIQVRSLEDLAEAVEAIKARELPLLIELMLDAGDMPRMKI